MKRRHILILFALFALSTNIIHLSSANAEPSDVTGGATIAPNTPPVPPTDSGNDPNNAPSTANSNDLQAANPNTPQTTINPNTQQTAIDPNAIPLPINGDAISGGIEETSSSSADAPVPELPEHNLAVAPFPKDYRIRVQLVTTVGNIPCELYADTHPLTVLNFVALATGSPAWRDASGTVHSTPYYKDIPFGSRKRGAFVVSGDRPEGTGFYVVDERCSVHGPVAGAIAMSQLHPGTASSNFILLARDITEFNGMYAVFGQCENIEAIEQLTKQKAVLERVIVE